MKKVNFLFLLVSMLMLANVQSYAQFNPIKFQVKISKTGARTY